MNWYIIWWWILSPIIGAVGGYLCYENVLQSEWACVFAGIMIVIVWRLIGYWVVPPVARGYTLANEGKAGLAMTFVVVTAILATFGVTITALNWNEDFRDYAIPASAGASTNGESGTPSNSEDMLAEYDAIIADLEQQKQDLEGLISEQSQTQRNDPETQRRMQEQLEKLKKLREDYRHIVDGLKRQVTGHANIP